jgi:hypothetical protein
MPELRDPPPDREMFRHQPQTGCHLCDARHPGGPVVWLLPRHAYVCLRHSTWLGLPDIHHPALHNQRGQRNETSMFQMSIPRPHCTARPMRI